MIVQYRNTCEKVDWNQVSKIFEVIGWGKRPPRKVKAAFQKSSFMRFAYVNDKMVGMGRTVDDGIYYAWVVDLAVLPEYQGMGIGSFILNGLEKDLEPFISTMLTAAPGKSSFYEKLGWLKQSAAYVWPRSENQKRDFTSHC